MNCRKAVAAVLALCLAAGGLSGCQAVKRASKAYPDWTPATEFDSPSEGWLTVDEQNGTRLEIEPASFSLRLTRGDTVWESRDGSGDDAEENTAYDSPLVLYGLQIGGDEFVLDANVSCIQKGQYEVTVEDGKVNAVFTIGTLSTRLLAPQVIRKEEMESRIFAHLDDSDLTYYQKRYTLYSKEDYPEEDAAYAALKEKYPLIEKSDLYILRSGVGTREKNKLTELTKGAGFTEEMLDAEYAVIGFEDETAKTVPLFEVPLTLCLDNGDLVASIEAENIRFDTSAFVLNRIDLLRNLTASDRGVGKELFLPDGSGAIVDLTQEKYRLGKITRTVYGDGFDPAGSYGKESASFPVFAMSRQNASLMAILEQGEAMAEITASYAGAVAGIWPSFVHQALYTSSAQDGWNNIVTNSYDPDLPGDVTFAVRYRLLGETGYAALANSYRDYLTAKGAFGEGGVDSVLPFYVETLGSVDVRERVLAFPVEHEVALTTFDQDAELIRRVAEAGVKNAVFRLTGALNGGLMNKTGNQSQLCRVLGSRGDWDSLWETAEEADASLYPDVVFDAVTKDGWFDGFRATRDTARGLNERYISRAVVNQATGEQVTDSYAFVLRPTCVSEYVQRFLKKDRLCADALAVGGLAQMLAESHTSRVNIHRGESEAQITASLQALAENRSLLLTGCNAYALPYADYLTGLPVSSSEYADYAQSVPFLSMVLHGRKNYALTALNRETDSETAVLRAIETGSGVSVVLAAQNTGKLRSTAYSFYYSVDADYWLPKALAAYERVEAAVGDVQQEAIVDHLSPADGVTLTVYEGGKQILVNYNETPVTVAGVTVAARDWAAASLTEAQRDALRSPAAEPSADTQPSGEEGAQ